jgi:hypothetical protein
MVRFLLAVRLMPRRVFAAGVVPVDCPTAVLPEAAVALPTVSVDSSPI